MGCSQCRDGYVFAMKRETWESGDYVFRCTCSYGESKRGARIPQWSLKQEREYVAEYQDPPLKRDWVLKMIEEKRSQEPEFKRRLLLWGRGIFEQIWKQHEAEKKEKKDEASNSS
jgi:hypothetical protein